MAICIAGNDEALIAHDFSLQLIANFSIRRQNHGQIAQVDVAIKINISLSMGRNC